MSATAATVAAIVSAKRRNNILLPIKEETGDVPSLLFVLRKPLARRVVQKKTYVDNGEIKTPFAIIGVRSANCTNKQREVIQSERRK